MLRRLALLLTLLLLGGCVYFNTFFHAKQAYKEAEKQRLKVGQEVATGGAANKYNDAIKNASKVLQNHPDSKYADDAFLMIGKSFYHTGEYARAREKFIELTGVFRESPLLPEARFYLGMCEYQLGFLDRAEVILKEMAETSKDKKLRDHAQFMLAWIPFGEERYEEALPLLYTYVGKYSGSSRRIRADSMIAASYWEIEAYDSARVAYERLSRRADDPDLKFEALYRRSEAAYDAGHFAAGLAEFRDLADDDKYFEQRGILRYQVGMGLWALDSVSEAMTIFRDLKEDYPSSEAAARGLFALGEIYEAEGESLAVAQEHFREIAKVWNRDPEFAADAVRRGTQIGQLLTLQGRISGQDSARFAESHFLMGELYMRQLEYPDSALEEFRRVVDDYSESHYAPLALLNLAELVVERDGDSALARRLWQVLVDRYPGTEASIWSRRRLNLPPPADVAASDILLLYGAESQLLDYGNPDSALALYELLITKFPESAYLPKALFARAWVLQNYFPREDSTVYLAYKYVADNFRGTVYAEAANRQLNPATRTAREIATAFTDTVRTDTSYTDTAAIKTTIAELADTTILAPPPAEEGLFDYPVNPPGFTWQSPLEVVFMIHINDRGEVEDDLELVGSSGYKVFDDNARTAMLQTRFNPMDLDPFLTMQRSWYKYSYFIVPPGTSKSDYPDLGQRLDQGYDQGFDQQ
jgi:TolA-binding protein